MRCREIPMRDGEKAKFSLPAYAVDFRFDGKLAERRQGQAQEQHDSPIQSHEGIAKHTLNLFRRALYSRWIGNTPMSGDRLARPNGADFICRVVADGENEIHPRRIGLRKFIPTLAAEALGRSAGKFNLFQRLRANNTGRMATRAIRREIWPAFSIQNGLSHDGSCRISGAQKENII